MEKTLDFVCALMQFVKDLSMCEDGSRTFLVLALNEFFRTIV